MIYNDVRLRYLITTVVVLVGCMFIACAACQRTAPSAASRQFRRRALRRFYDNQVVPFGLEVRGYSSEGIRSRYFVVVDVDETPITVSLTPCGSSVRWTLTYHDMNFDTPRQSQELFSQGEVNSSRRRLVDNVWSYVGRQESFYETLSSPRGMYVLEVDPPASDTAYRMFATTSPQSAYGSLPRDPYVKIDRVSKTRLSVSWAPSPAAWSLHRPIEYCVALNTNTNFKSHCELESRLLGDLPAQVGYHFSDFGNIDPFVVGREEAAGPSDDTIRHADSLQYYCVCNETSYTFRHLEPGVKYYIDVFTVDTDSDRRISYRGAYAHTKRHQEKQHVLRDGVRRAKTIRFSSSFRIFASPSRRRSELYISISACSGNVSASLFLNSTEIRSLAHVADYDAFIIGNFSAGFYTVQIINHDNAKSKVELMATSRKNKYPYPRLPLDRTLYEYTSLKTCTSVDLGWMGTSDDTEYCLHKRRFHRRRKPTSAACRPVDDSREVACVRYSNPNEAKAVVPQTVTNLRPGRLYEFQVYARRVDRDDGEWAPFNSLVTGASRDCHPNRS